MTFSETIDGAVASLFFFDKAKQSTNMNSTEDNYNYGHYVWYIVLGACLYLGLKVMIKRYFSSKKTKQTEITQKRKSLGIAVGGTKTINPKNQVDPMRSIQLPRSIRKSLQERQQTKTLSTSTEYHVHSNMDSPQLAVISTAEVSKITEQSSRYHDAVSISRVSVKGQYFRKGSPKMSSQILPENSVRRSCVAPLHSADNALEVRHSPSKGHSKLSPHLSKKRRCQQFEVIQPQDTNNILTPEEEVLDCNIRCEGDHEPERKLSLYLNYSKHRKVSQKMRSMFSRSKLATECRSEQRSFGDLRFEDGTSCYTSVSRLPEEEINTQLAIPETLKATISKAKQTCDILGKGFRHVHDISQIESQRPTEKSGVKKKSVKHVCKEKEYGVGSLDDMYSSLMCLNKTHKALTAPYMKNEDFHDGSNPARRKWQKMYKDTLEAVDLPYRSCPSKAPLLLEVFAPGAFQKTDTAKIDRHCQIGQANFENSRALKRNRRIRVSKDEHGESMAMDIFEIVATQTQPTDFKNSRSSTIRFARNRKRVCSGIQKKALESKIKEDRRSLVGKKNDMCSGFAGTDISLSLQNRMVLQGTKGSHICHNIKEYDIHPTAKKLNLAKHDRIKYHHIPVIRGQEMPQRSKVHKKRRRKTSTTALPLFDRGPESIRMVESLLSVTDAEALEPLNIPTASTPDHIKIDLLKMPREEENIEHKKRVKKSLRFAANTETLGVSIPMPSTTQTSPSEWSESEQIVNPVSDNTVNGKVNNKSKTPKKHTKSLSYDQKLFDKLALQGKDDIKNALRLCQSVESRVCDKMSVAKSQSPNSVRIQNIRSRTRRYPTLTSFLDHIEKKNNILKDGQSQVEDQNCPVVKISVIAAETKRVAKDPIVTQEEEDIAMIACPNMSNLASGVRKYATEGIKKDYISVCPCSNLTTGSGQQQTQKQDDNLGLHFGTDSLQLYTESVDSVNVVKKDNETVRDVKVLLPRQSKTGSYAKKQHVMKNEPAANSGSLQKLRRPTKEAEPFAPPKATEKAELKFLRRNSLRTIKKDASKETSTRENNGLHKVMSSVLNVRKSGMGKEHFNKPQPCTTNGALSSPKLQSNPKHRNTKSLLAFADPSRRSGNLAETEWLEIGHGDSPKVSGARMLIADCRTDELVHTPVITTTGNIDTFREIISMEQHPVKSPMSGKSVQLSSLNRSRSIELSSPFWICAADEVNDSPGQLGTPLKEVKTMYPCNNTISSPLTKMPLILKTEDTKNIALEALQVDNTPPRIRKRIRRLKTCSLGHVISKLSEAEIKPPRSDAFRDTDLSSTSKSLASTDINGMRTTQNVATGTQDKMPVIVKKLLIDSTKRQSYDPLGTSCEKQHSPNVEPASPMQNLGSASFSRNQQPLQSIRRGSLKDIFDRYVVHTSEHPRKQTARITGKTVRHPKTGEGDVHCSLTDLDASARSPTVTSCRVKPDVSQRNISSYTSKYRANDNIDKSVRSPWRGTVAFRKRLQHLLQHNKHIQNKYRHINMTAKKTSPVNISTSKLNSGPANKDKVENMYKVSRIVRPGQVPSHNSDVKHEIFMGASELGKASNIHAARRVVTPVSKLLVVRDEFIDVIVDNSNKDLTVHSVKSPLQDKTTDEENINVSMIPSPTAPHPLETSAHPPPQKVTHSSKNIITHSDHFEKKIINQPKRYKVTLEQKLKQTRGNFETKVLSNVIPTDPPTKPSAPCYVSSSRRAVGSRPRVPWLHERPGQMAGKPLETIPSVAEPEGKQMATVDLQAKPATDVTDSPLTTIPSSQQTSNSEGAVADTATGKLCNNVPVVGLISGHSVDSTDIQAEVTRSDFLTPEQQFASAGDTPLVGTTKKEMTRVSETEHNLQLLLDKIKHRSSLTPPASKGKEKENVDAPVGIIGKPDSNIHNKQMQLHPKLAKTQQSAERIPHSVPIMENVTEQTKSNFKTDKKAAADVTYAACESFPLSVFRVEKGSTTSQKLVADIKKMHEGKRKTDNRTSTKAVSKTEFAVKNRRQSMTADNSKRESHDSSKPDEKAKLSARKIMYNKYKLMPRNKAKKATSSLDKMTKPGNKNSTTSVSNLKHVAFDVHERVEKSITESYGTITSEAASQESRETCINADDAEVFHSRGAKTVPLHNKVRQTMSVLNILNTDEAERVGKNAPRQDVQLEQVSDTSHTNEKQQSSTEATGKLPCSSGYGTMDMSTTSFSHLHNSSSLEPGKLAVEPVTAREVCSPCSHSDKQHDHAVLHVCKQGELFHESFERVPQAGSLTTFRKKDLHMDVIPEEADHENGVDSQADKDSAKSKLSESEMKKYEVEEKGLEYMAGKEQPGEMLDTDNADVGTVNKSEVENISSDQDTVSLEQCEAGQETEDPVLNIPVPAHDFDENYMEMPGDVTESPMETLKKRNSVTDTRTRELSVPDAEDIVGNQCDTVSEHSPPDDTLVPEQVDRDSLSSSHLDQAVAETISQIVGKHAYLTNMAPEKDSCASRLHESQLLDMDVQNTTLDCPHVTPEEETRCEEIREVNDFMSTDNNVVVAKESASFTTETKSERPKLSDHHIYSSMFAKTLEHYRQVSHSKSDSTATKPEAEVGDFISTTEMSKQSMFLGEKNKSDLSTVPMKSTIYDIQETKSVSSVAERSYSSSDNLLSQGVFQCTDDLDAPSRKPQHEEIDPHNIANTHKEDTDLKKVSQTSSILKNAASSSQTELPNSDDDSTFQKLSEPSTANNLDQGDSTISQNKPAVGCDLSFGDKLTPDTNILSLTSNGSEATMNSCSRDAPFRISALDGRPTAETQTTEFDVYSRDGVRAVTQTSDFDIYNGDGIRAVTKTSEIDIYNGDGVRAVTQTSEIDIYNGDGVRAVTQTSEIDIYNGDGVRAVTQTSEIDIYNGDGVRAVTQTSEIDIYNGDGVRAVTQTAELCLYPSDGVRKQTSVGLQVEYNVDGENTHSSKDSSGWNRENIPKSAVSPISSEVEVTNIEKYRSRASSDIKIVLSSGGRKDKTDDNDAPAESVIREQNVNVTKEIPISIVEVTKEEKVVAQDTRRQAHPEGSSQGVMDDLESLLNKELNQVNVVGGLKQVCEVNRLFGTYHDRNTRKEKRRRRSEQTLKQMPSQRELHYHFVRENDGSVKKTSSNTSQHTTFSQSDTGAHLSSRAIRPLALGRVTKLEEFLQKAEETNRSETTLNVSRAVSKLSSLTSVTPSSQEEQLTPLKCQNTRSNKTAKFKQKAPETEGSRGHETSKINTIGSVSGKSSQLSRIKNIKSNQLHASQVSENQQEDDSCECPRYTSNNDRSPFQDCVSDCTGNNDDSHVAADGGRMLHRTESNTAEQARARTYRNKTPSAGYSLRAEITVETRARDNTQGWIASADTGSNTYLIQNEASVNVRVTEAVGPSNHGSKYMFAQHQQPIANIVPAQATDECSALSTSSSSIVLSWIGSDLGDVEEIIQTPNFTDQEDKVYSDDATELHNYHLHAPLANEAREFPIVTENTQLLYPEYQSRDLYSADVSKPWRSCVIDSVSHLTPMSGIILQESAGRIPEYRLQHDSDATSRVPHPGDNVGHSKLTRLKQNKDILPMDSSLPGIEHALFETAKKEAKHTSQQRLPSNNHFQCPMNETLIRSPVSSKAPRTLPTFWNNNPKDCTLEQPSYFNALLRDPKWNPAFEIKDVSNKVGHHSEETGAAGSYVQSAWTYQRVRHMSPIMFSPQTGQECNSSMHPHSVKQQYTAQEKPDTYLDSSISAQPSNTKITFDMCSIRSNQSDPRSHRYPKTHTPPRHAFIIQCSQNRPVIHHSERDEEGNARMAVSQDFATRGMIKQVHFDGNFKPDQIGPVYVESTSRPDTQSWALVHAANNKSTQQLSLDKHLKTSAGTGAVPVKSRLSSEQRSQGTESTKTKTKMSLEQHLCSTFDTDRNSMSNAAQPSSENGTTKSTSSHASLNWYKPQSLPSSTSVSNGNTSHGHQETSAQQEPSHGHERSRRPRTPHSEIGITKTSKRSTSGSARKQNTHTLEHSEVNSPNLVPSLSRSTHGKTSAQKSRKFSPGTQHNLLAQTLIPSLVPRADKGSSDSLSTPSSTSAHNSSRNQVPGFCWLRDPGASRVTRQTLPYGNIRVNGNKSTCRLANTSNQLRGGSKTSNEDRTLANHARGFSSNSGKPHTLSNNRSCYTSHFNAEKKPKVNTLGLGACETSSSHTQSVRRTRGSSVCSAPNHNSEPRSSAEDVLDTTTTGGTQHRTKPLSAHLSSDGGASGSHHSETDAASLFQGARRVSKLVEMFEKKRVN